ncbi:arylesterase [candidate division KSB1 bacterium]|nr:MAG: arylesterase [candidate division KSB1 bacterium]MBC6950581.1 arylesterase [candidate division KSB1 bacterium]MCE7944365.1 arylesterase [Chlorobi bacterium CHB1]MDL1878024.1 arylesterase [Cytophagia bacterium CHB2]
MLLQIPAMNIIFLLLGLMINPHNNAAPVQDNKSAEPRTILFLGNSLSAGYGLGTEFAFPALIQEKIDSLGWNFKVINAGLSGETSSGGLRRIDWLLQRKIDVFFLELGANDGLRGIPLDLTQQNLQAIIDRVKAKNAEVRIVIAGMLVPPNMGREYSSKFRTLFQELAKKNEAALVPFLLEGVGGNPKLNLPDGIHPTAEGHRIVARNVWQVLKPVLQEM